MTRYTGPMRLLVLAILLSAASCASEGQVVGVDGNQSKGGETRMNRGFYLTASSAATPLSREEWATRLAEWGCDNLVIYGSHKELENSRRLVQMIDTMKSVMPTLTVALAGETPELFARVLKDSRLTAAIDGFNYEFEYWNYAVYGYPSRADAFNRALDDLGQIKLLASGRRLFVEAYLGWFDAGEATKLLPLLDRLLLHSYAADPVSIAALASDRIVMISAIAPDLPWLLLLSAESRFSGPALKALGFEMLESAVTRALRGQSPGFSGIHWFTAEFAWLALGKLR
jgi:hypothetical protein